MCTPTPQEQPMGPTFILTYRWEIKGATQEEQPMNSFPDLGEIT